MFARALRHGLLDRLAIGLSGLCIVHCIASASVVALLASAGGALLDPIVHEVGLMIALVLGIVGLGRGIVLHGHIMPALVGGLGLGVMAGALGLPHGEGSFHAIIGVAILALGHDLNRRALS
ncbi:MAG: MerC domain-containing protein [Sphingomonadaceae bacterium]